jgi:taurine dioxygenase
MRVTPSGKEVGVIIDDVDVKVFAPADFDRLYDAWLTHGVLAIRCQVMDIPAFLAFTKRFGRLHLHPSKITRHPEYPELTVMGINKYSSDGQLNRAVYARGGESFHTDGAYDRHPFKATCLYAVAIPDTGGDTLFAAMNAAYGSLDAGLREVVRDAVGLFTYSGRSGKSAALLQSDDRSHPPAPHRLVNIHPETGCESLYFDPGKIVGIEGMPSDEADDVIEQLAAAMVRADRLYRHQWQVGDFVIWDNRAVYHKAAADYPPEQDRIHWRVSIKPSDAPSAMDDLGA